MPVDRLQLCVASHRIPPRPTTGEPPRMPRAPRAGLMRPCGEVPLGHLDLRSRPWDGLRWQNILPSLVYLPRSTSAFPRVSISRASVLRFSLRRTRP
jgi:hypothetical protein